jgi:hypothetical protein
MRRGGMMSKRKMTVEYLRAMVKKSFSDVDIDESGKMCVLPFQSLVDTVNLYEDKLAWQEVEIQQLTEEKAELQKQADELKAKIEQGTLIELPFIWKSKKNSNEYVVVYEDEQTGHLVGYCCVGDDAKEKAEKWLKDLQE